MIHDLNLARDGASFRNEGRLFHAKIALKTRLLVVHTELFGRVRGFPQRKLTFMCLC